ncbi:DUF3800 domain-containing protein [Mesorhizobium sp. M0309]|uniref:DUF3800 domain-containing protein n=1 Tax=Mesorhizobium sp. M0309 TaxID=2956933 RepID=UPI003334ED4F
MWAYVDETGNTGNNLFDPEQPLFITAAFMTKSNFDLVERASIAAIAKKVDSAALHANVLGVARIEEIAADLHKVLKRADPRFFLSRLEKLYLSATKVVDTFFDQGENHAVPWHVYWLRPMRLMLTFKLAKFVITEDIAQTVWKCVTAKSEATSKAFFVEAAKAMLEHVDNLPDARSRQVVREALEWAVANPENFSTYLSEKALRYTHSPNFVAFTNLLDGLDDASTRWKRPLREIVHDKQAELEKTFASWHATVSKPELADAEPLHWPGEAEPIKVQKVSGSTFRTSTEDDSPGLQVVDVLLWSFKRVFEGKDVGQNTAKLLNWASKRTYQHDFSFQGVGESAEAAFHRIMNADLPDKAITESKDMLENYEQNRRKHMTAYADAKAGKLIDSVAKDS